MRGYLSVGTAIRNTALIRLCVDNRIRLAMQIRNVELVLFACVGDAVGIITSRHARDDIKAFIVDDYELIRTSS